MSKKVIESRNYTEYEINEAMAKLVTSAHNFYIAEEKRCGKGSFEKFGEWRERNPNHPLAKANYPKGEYIQVITMYKPYFDKKYSSTKLDIDL